MFCNVIVTRPFDQIFTYKLKKGQSVKEGTIVSAPFGKKKNQIGMVKNRDFKLKISSNLTKMYPKSIFFPDFTQ